MCFASKVTNHFYLKDYSSRAGIVSAIDRIVPSNGAATAIGLGLQVGICKITLENINIYYSFFYFFFKIWGTFFNQSDY